MKTIYIILNTLADFMHGEVFIPRSTLVLIILTAVSLGFFLTSWAMALLLINHP